MVIDSEVKDLVAKAEETHGEKASYYLAATILWLEDYCKYLEDNTSAGFIRSGSRDAGQDRKDN